MSRNRYQILLRFICFCNNENQVLNADKYSIKSILSSVDKPNLVDFIITLLVHPKGFERYEVFVPLKVIPQ